MYVRMNLHSKVEKKANGKRKGGVCKECQPGGIVRIDNIPRLFSRTQENVGHLLIPTIYLRPKKQRMKKVERIDKGH
jgi:hypothetical protein